MRHPPGHLRPGRQTAGAHDLGDVLQQDDQPRRPPLLGGEGDEHGPHAARSRALEAGGRVRGRAGHLHLDLAFRLSQKRPAQGREQGRDGGIARQMAGKILPALRCAEAPGQQSLGSGIDRDDRPRAVDRHDAGRGAAQDLLDVVAPTSQIVPLTFERAGHAVERIDEDPRFVASGPFDPDVQIARRHAARSARQQGDRPRHPPRQEVADNRQQEDGEARDDQHRVLDLSFAAGRHATVLDERNGNRADRPLLVDAHGSGQGQEIEVARPLLGQEERLPVDVDGAVGLSVHAFVEQTRAVELARAGRQQLGVAVHVDVLPHDPPQPEDHVVVDHPALLRAGDGEVVLRHMARHLQRGEPGGRDVPVDLACRRSCGEEGEGQERQQTRDEEHRHQAPRVGGTQGQPRQVRSGRPGHGAGDSDDQQRQKTVQEE